MPDCPQCRAVLEGPANFCVACGTDLRSAEQAECLRAMPDPLVGQVVAERYRILELVGRGGMGVVYKVEHIRMGKLMAIKLLHGELASDRAVVKRFRREAMAVSRLSHPNTVQIFDYGRSDGLVYLVMEYVDGTDLGTLVRRDGPIPVPRCALIMLQVCGSLAEAHDVGIVHRDLKPENVLVCQTRDQHDVAKVLDFGLAKLREAEEMAEITSQGSLVGTPYYMSPEQIRGENVDHRADIYALGAMMYKVVSGNPPFSAGTPVGVLTKHLTEEVRPLCDRFPDLALASEVDELIVRCLAKKPADRFQSVDEVRLALLSLPGVADSEDVRASISGAGSWPGSSLSGVRVRATRAQTREPGGEKAAPDDVGSRLGRVGDRMIQISSRSDYDRFERALRVRRGFSWIIAAVVVLCAATAGALSVHRWRTAPVTVESEPNDEPAQAERIAPGRTVHGTIGKRISLSQSDRDWFVLPSPRGGKRVVRVEVSGVPRMDIIVQLFDESLDAPLAEANLGAQGQPETIAGVSADGVAHYVLVREVWVSGRAPTENVSDEYELRADLLDPASHEGEPNDEREVATPIEPNHPIVGYVGRPGDVDCYRIARGGGDGGWPARVTAPEDLELRASSGDGAELPVRREGRELLVSLLSGDVMCLRAASPGQARPMEPYRLTATVGRRPGR